MKLSDWISELRTSRVLANLEAPEMPAEVRAAWMAAPQVSERSGGRRTLGARLALTCATLAAVGLLVSQNGLDAVAQTVSKGITEPRDLAVQAIQTGTDISLFNWLAPMMVTVAAIGLAILLTYRGRRQPQAEPADRSHDILSRPFVVVLACLWMFFSYMLFKMIAEELPTVRLVLALVVPGLVFGYVFAAASSAIAEQSARSGVLQNVRYVSRLVIGAFLWSLFAARPLDALLHGMQPVIWLPAIVIGWLTAPMFMRRMRRAA